MEQDQPQPLIPGLIPHNRRRFSFTERRRFFVHVAKLALRRRKSTTSPTCPFARPPFPCVPRPPTAHAAKAHRGSAYPRRLSPHFHVAPHTKRATHLHTPADEKRIGAAPAAHFPSRARASTDFPFFAFTLHLSP